MSYEHLKYEANKSVVFILSPKKNFVRQLCSSFKADLNSRLRLPAVEFVMKNKISTACKRDLLSAIETDTWKLGHCLGIIKQLSCKKHFCVSIRLTRFTWHDFHMAIICYQNSDRHLSALSSSCPRRLPLFLLFTEISCLFIIMKTKFPVFWAALWKFIKRVFFFKPSERNAIECRIWDTCFVFFLGVHR